MGKVLIVYYSRSGGTKDACAKLKAEHDQFGVIDMIELKDEKPYNAITALIAAMTKKAGKIQPLDIDMTQYDVVVLGTPIWGGGLTPAMKTFITSTNLNGKKIIGILSSSKKEPEYPDVLRTAVNNRVDMAFISGLTRLRVIEYIVIGRVCTDEPAVK